MMEFRLRQPCATCPFRCDIEAYLTTARATEIALSLQTKTFACHETTAAGGPPQPRVRGKYAKRVHQHCAGAMILMYNSGCVGDLHQVAERLGMFDPTLLRLESPVFQNFAAFIAAQPINDRLRRMPRRIWYEHGS